MATFRMINMKGKYKNRECVSTLVNYLLKNKRTGEENRFIGGYGIPLNDKESIVQSFQFVKAIKKKKTGKLIWHFCITFAPEEYVDAEMANRIGWKVAALFKDYYQILFSVHEDTDLVHIHFAINSVSFADVKKFRIEKHRFKDFCEFIEEVANPRNLDRDYSVDIRCFIQK